MYKNVLHDIFLLQLQAYKHHSAQKSLKLLHIPSVRGYTYVAKITAVWECIHGQQRKYSIDLFLYVAMPVSLYLDKEHKLIFCNKQSPLDRKNLVNSYIS